MILTPSSIKNNKTLAIEAVWLERLKRLNHEQLKINFETEQNPAKLTAWLEMFGIPIELIPDNFNDFRLRELIRRASEIYKLSGTSKSIELIAEALGVTISVHTGAYKNEIEDNHYSVSIVTPANIKGDKRTEFINDFLNLFYISQPAHLWVNDIKPQGVFSTKFNFNFR